MLEWKTKLPHPRLEPTTPYPEGVVVPAELMRITITLNECKSTYIKWTVGQWQRCGYLLAYVQEFHFSIHYTQINDYLSRITDTACQTLSLSNDDMEFMDESSDYRRCRNDSCSCNQDAKVIRLAMASNIPHELFGLIFQRLMQLEWQFWMAVNHSCHPGRETFSAITIFQRDFHY